MRSTQHRGWPKKNGVFRFLFVNAIEETRIFSGGPNQFLISVLYTMQKRYMHYAKYSEYAYCMLNVHFSILLTSNSDPKWDKTEIHKFSCKWPQSDQDNSHESFLFLQLRRIIIACFSIQITCLEGCCSEITLRMIWTGLRGLYQQKQLIYTIQLDTSHGI